MILSGLLSNVDQISSANDLFHSEIWTNVTDHTSDLLDFLPVSINVNP